VDNVLVLMEIEGIIKYKKLMEVLHTFNIKIIIGWVFIQTKFCIYYEF